MLLGFIGFSVGSLGLFRGRVAVAFSIGRGGGG